MSRLLDFYRGRATDNEGRWLRDLWDWDDDALESVHDFIQWLFPLPEPSQFNPNAPLLTPADVAAFRADASLRANLRRSFERILSFLGFAERPDESIAEGPNFAARTADVWCVPNHNWLRITRILRCLTLLGLEAEARALYACLNGFYQSRKFPIPDSTFRYWSAAVRSGSDT
ncbi:MAG TPA: opioid growth factor receptor-related protein [Gemmataceae bacterium]|nr:opioid growth factor receptor-related protein [Gemmataceae bacterium]